MFKRIPKKITDFVTHSFVLWQASSIVAVISLAFPMGAIEKGLPFLNHIFLLIWAIVAMVVARQISWQKKSDKGEIAGDVIVAGVVVYSGLALFLIVLGDYYREIIEARSIRVSGWKVFVYAAEILLLASGSKIVIWRTNGWSASESRDEQTAEKEDEPI